jgi:hypothetical protein
LVKDSIANKIIVHEAATADVQHQMQQDIAVIQVQQEAIAEDIKEIKELIRSQ